MAGQIELYELILNGYEITLKRVSLTAAENHHIYLKEYPYELHIKDRKTDKVSL